MSARGSRRRDQGAFGLNRADARLRAAIEPLETRTLLHGLLDADPHPPAMWLPKGHFVQSPAGFLTQPSKSRPLDIALRYLSSSARQLGLTADDVANPFVTDLYTDAGTGVTHIYLRQRFNNLPVVNSNLNVNVARDGRILSVGGGFVSFAPGTPHARSVQAAAKAAAVTPQQAIAAVSRLAGVQDGRAVPVTSWGTLQGAPAFAAPDVSLDPIVPQLYYVATAGEVNLAWNLSVRTPDLDHWYDLNVDASTGAVIGGTDWMSHATYTVYPYPTEAPNDAPSGTAPRVTVTDPHDPVASPFGWHDTNGIAGPEFTDTRGNNVSAQEDVNADNAGGLRPTGGSTLDFDYPLDLTQSPASYQSAAIVNLFYWNNLAHDIHYRYGFNEAAGNFQVKNYSGAGLGNDAVQADAQDGSGTNNANFATPPDGQAPRMQMFLFNRTTPGRDGDFDAGIILHEYGHGVSNRLTGGPSNASALQATQSGGMGEGWSDWWGLMLTMRPTDTKDARYPVGTYVLGQSSTTGAGIRRYPYAFDMAVNPLTFAAYNADASKQVHRTGEIWASTLWDMTWLLIDKHGFGADYAKGYDPLVPGQNGGNNLALQLVMDALKLQPANPSFIQARDAVLQADQIRTGGANKLQIWTAFARRGLGAGAATASSGSGTVTISITLPPDLLKPRVASHAPATVTTALPTYIDITFSKAMNPASFTTAADVVSFTAPDGSDLRPTITGATWLSSNTTLRIAFAAATANGTYTLVIGPDILSADDATPMDQDGDGTPAEPVQDRYTATFSHDALQLAVLSTSPASASTAPLPLTSLDITFNEPLLPSSVSPSDIALSRGTVTAATLLNPTTVRYTLSGLTTEGPVTLTLPAGALSDTSGFPMAAYSGTFTLDFTTQPLPPAQPQSPAGSLAYTTSATGTLGTPGDTDSFTLTLAPGQTLAAWLAPTAAALRPTLTLLDPAGNLVDFAIAPTAGATALIQATPTTPGTYTLIVSGSANTTGAYTLTALLNAAVESESRGGPTNNTLATAQPLDPAFTPIGNALASRAAALGTTTGSGTDQDYYTLTLSAGDLLTAAATALTGGLPTLTLLGPTGATLATGLTTSANLSSLISTFLIPTTGTYYLRVSAPASSTYSLTATRNASFDTEPNDSLPTAQNISSTQTAIGAIGPSATLAPSTTEDFETGTLGPAWSTYSSDSLGRIRVSNLGGAASGTYALLMDRNDQASGTYTLNEAVWSVNFAGLSAATLSFSHASFADEIHTLPTSWTNHTNGDGVSFSADGQTWYRLWQPTTSSSAWTAATVDLAAAASAAGIPLSSITRIKFQQYDNFAMSTDGRGFDNLVISTPLSGDDYYAVHFTAGQPIHFTTSTPGTPAGADFPNTLDPALDLYDPAGNLLATDDNGAPDGRNASLTTMAPTTGLYRIRVRGVSGTRGEYVLDAHAQTQLDGSPGQPDLLPASDTGPSATDNLTRQSSSLSFLIPGTLPGATVTLYLGDTPVASAVATTGATLLTTDPTLTLPDGTHTFMARQTPAGGTESPASAPLTLTISSPTPVTPSSPTLQATSDSGLSNSDGITNDNTPTFSISVPTPYFRLYRNGTLISGPYETGTTFTPPAQPDGTHTYTLTAVDAAGNESAPSTPTTLTIDTAPPAAPTSPLDLRAALDTGQFNTDNTTSINTPVFDLPNPTGSYFRVYRGGILISDFYATGTSFAPPAQADGSATWQYAFVDAAGNVSTISSSISLSIDTTPPAAPAPPDLQPASDTGLSNTDNLTSVTTPTFTVAGSPYFRLYRDGTLVSAEYQTGTAYTTPALPSGTYAFTLVAVDAAGNTSPPSPALTVTIDTAILPAPALYAGSDTGLSSSDRITAFNNASPTTALTFVVTNTTPGATLSLYADGTLVGTAIAAGPTAIVTTDGLTPIPDGLRQFTIRQTLPGADAPSPDSTPLAVTIDTAAPTAPSLPDLLAASDTGFSSTDNITSATSPTLTVTGTTHYRLLLNGAQISGDFQTGNFTLPAKSDGTYALSALAVDLAGNVSPAGPTLQLTIDTVAPLPPTTAPDLLPSSDTGVSDSDDITAATNLAFAVSGAAPYFRFFRNGALVSGNYQSGTTYTTSTQTSGTWSYALAAVDAAGNVSALSPALPVLINTLPPAAPPAPDLLASSDSGASPTDNITNVTTPTFAVTTSASAPYFRLYVDGILRSADFATGPTFTLPTPLADGTHTVTIYAVSAAGLATPGPALTITIDTVAPTLSVPDLRAASDSGVSTTDDITNVRTPIVDLTTSEAATIRILIDGSDAIVPAANAPAQGTHGITLAPPASGPAGFLPFSAIPTAAPVGRLTTADFNEDGKTDVLASAWGGHALWVFLSNGDGTFSLTQTLSTGGGQAFGTAVADFDRDGHPDAAVADVASNTISLFRGYGNGTFRPALVISPGTNAAQLAAGDFDADGNADLILSNFDDHSVGILRGKGNGSFHPQTVIAPVGTARQVITADFNTDGKLDFAIADQTADAVTLYLGTGTATFQAAGTFPVGNTALHLAVGDFDRDGRPDLANADYDDGTLSVLINNGNGTFQPRRVLTGLAHPLGLSAADFDHDGNLDLATANQSSPHTAVVFYGAGNGTFGPATHFPGSVYPMHSAVGDVDGNGAPDFLTGIYDGQAINVYLNAAPPRSLTDGPHAVAAYAIDLAGNVSAPTAPLTLTIDTTAPAPPSVAPDLQPDSDTGISNTDNLTNNTAPTFDVTLAPETYYRMYQDGRIFGQLYAFRPTFTAGDQFHGVVDWAYAYVDAAGNVSAPSPALTVTFDTVAPLVTVAPLTTDAPSPALTGTVNDPAASVVVTVSSAPYAATNHGDGTWTLPAGTISPDLLAGLYDVQVVATDTAGNRGLEWTTDELTILPPPPTISPEPPFTPGHSNTLSWAPVPGADQYLVEIDTDPTFASPDASSGWTPATSHTFTNLADGATYYYRVKSRRTVDAAGSWAQTSESDFAANQFTNATFSAASGGVILAGGTTVIFADDFEDGDFSGWTTGTGAYTRQVTTATAADGLHSLTLTGGSNTHYNGLSRPLNSTQPTKIAFSVRSATTNAAKSYVVLRQGTSIAAFFYMKDNGTAGLAFDDGSFIGIPYVANRWYDVELGLNWSARTVSLTIDGVVVTPSAPFRQAGITSLTTLDVYNYHNSQGWWDSFAVTTGAGYAAAGTVVSTPIGPVDRWSTLNYYGFTNTGTSVTVDVLDAATGNVLAANVPSGTDLHTLGIPTTAIRLRANLASPTGAATPSFFGWTLRYTNTRHLESAWSTPASSAQDATPPAVDADALTTIDTTPALTGTVDDPAASVVITIAGQSYPATNLGDGTWLLPDNANTSPLPAAPLTYTVTATDPAGNASTASAPLTVLPPPSLVTWFVNDGAAQRSMVRSLTLVFDQPVSLAAGAVQVKVHDSGAAVPFVAANPAGDGRTFLLTFSAPDLIGSSLADGLYDLTLRHDRIRDLFGRNPIGPNPTHAFHRLFGDADGDRDVDAPDTAAFAAAQATFSNMPAYRWYFDADQDNDIDAQDALLFRQHEGRSVFA